LALPKKLLRPLLLLLAVFIILFASIFVALSFTQSAYSTPFSSLAFADGMDITVGPAPNATNVPLDSAITVDALASASLSDLHLTPDLSIASTTSTTSGPLTYKTTFYPTEPLKPATTYTVSVTVINTSTSWSFTTQTGPFQPSTGYLLAKNAIWISIAVAAAATGIVALILWLKGKKVTVGFGRVFKQSPHKE